MFEVCKPKSSGVYLMSKALSKYAAINVRENARDAYKDNPFIAFYSSIFAS